MWLYGMQGLGMRCHKYYEKEWELGEGLAQLESNIQVRTRIKFRTIQLEAASEHERAGKVYHQKKKVGELGKVLQQ